MSASAQTLQTSREARAWMLWTGLLLGLTDLWFASILGALVLDWGRDPDYSHGFFVPLFSAFILWRERERWTRTPIKPSNLGFVVMLAAISILLLGSLGAELFTSR